MSAPADCRHKTMSSLSRLTHTNDSDGLALAGSKVRLWTCSDCGNEGPWSEAWAYYGSLECRACERAKIDHVSCGCKPQDRRP